MRIPDKFLCIPSQSMRMFCSIIIPTIGRSSLKRAVDSVINQDFDPSQYEIIVVNDTGKTLPDEHWLLSKCITIFNTQKRERIFARNSGAALAKGQYLWFLDDDDWILPGALHIFNNLSKENPNAVWLYGGLHIVNEKEEILAEMNSRLRGNCFAYIMGGAWAPIQASIVSSDAFFKLGGYTPDIIGTEDLDLCRRFAYLGEFANTGENVACLLRGESWNTSTDYNRAAEDTKKSRERLLSQPAAFTRLISSANDSYWLGRILRVYLSTVSWNLKNRRFYPAMSRWLYATIFILKANKHLLSRKFWAGVRADHVPGTLHFVMRTYEQRNKNGG